MCVCEGQYELCLVWRLINLETLCFVFCLHPCLITNILLYHRLGQVSFLILQTIFVYLCLCRLAPQLGWKCTSAATNTKLTCAPRCRSCLHYSLSVFVEARDVGVRLPCAAASVHLPSAALCRRRLLRAVICHCCCATSLTPAAFLEPLCWAPVTHGRASSGGCKAAIWGSL